MIQRQKSEKDIRKDEEDACKEEEDSRRSLIKAAKSKVMKKVPFDPIAIGWNSDRA